LTAAVERPQAEVGRREYIVLISLLMALTALAIDMMLPAFGEMRLAFGLAADSTAVAPVITVFFVGFGSGQLLWGPLSDALGRRPILWIGLAIYSLAAVGAALAPSLGFLLLLRLLGGLGAAAVRIFTQGSIRDRYRGGQMAKVLSYIMAVFLLVPMMAPTLGTAVLAIGDWRWIFAFFVVAAVLTGLWSTRLPETLPPEKRISPGAGRLIGAARLVLSSRFAMGFTIAQMAVFGFFASYLASTELILDDVFGLRVWFPLVFGGASLLLGAAMLFNPRLIDRFGLRRMVRFALTGYLAASSVFAMVALATGGHPPFWLYLVGVLPILVAHSFVMPNLNSAAMMPMGRVAGTASAIIGSIATLGGALIGASIDMAYDSSVTPFAVAGVLVCIVAFVAYRWSDAVWEESAERDLLPAGQRAQAAAAAPVEIA
jgi:DHA1 family bicyclomycin/chloramphenicol resistance-like MFS transporter